MKEKTAENVKAAFVGEAKAYFRLLAYAEKAEEEEVPQIALLFRSIAEAEKVHAMRHLSLMKDIVVKDTDTNLEKSFQNEISVSENVYPDFIKAAQDEGEDVAALTFSQARDAESFHAPTGTAFCPQGRPACARVSQRLALTRAPLPLHCSASASAPL